jgi:hypothetical protein
MLLLLEASDFLYYITQETFRTLSPYLVMVFSRPYLPADYSVPQLTEFKANCNCITQYLRLHIRIGTLSIKMMWHDQLIVISL